MVYLNISWHTPALRWFPVDQTLKKNVDKAQNKSSGYFPHRFSAVDLDKKYKHI